MNWQRVFHSMLPSGWRSLSCSVVIFCSIIFEQQVNYVYIHPFSIHIKMVAVHSKKAFLELYIVYFEKQSSSVNLCILIKLNTCKHCCKLLFSVWAYLFWCHQWPWFILFLVFISNEDAQGFSLLLFCMNISSPIISHLKVTVMKVTCWIN